MKENKEDNIISFLETFTEAIGRSDEENIEEVISDLEEEGFDISASVKRIKEKVQSISQEARRKQLAMAEKRLSLGKESAGKFKDLIELSKDHIINKIKELYETSALLPSVSYRDLELKTNEDLIALLEDLEMAKEMEKESINHEA